MKVKNVTERKRWQTFIHTHSRETFHQSWEWATLHETLQNKVWKLGIYSGKDLVGIALVVLIKAKRGSFLLVPHGPLLKNGLLEKKVTKALDTLHTTLEKIGKEHSCAFIRAASTFPRTGESKGLFSNIGYRSAPIFAQSELSWELNIKPDTEVLLRDMRKSTRYILKRANKHSVRYHKATDPKAFSIFIKLYDKTVSIQEFFGQNERFIQAEFEAFLIKDKARLYFIYDAEDSEPLATALIITEGKVGYYHYGASRRSEKKIPAPHLLQWYIIQDLKRDGYEMYNFWGICDEDQKGHPWQGLSLFKRGFGGHELRYLQTQDYILQWTYWLTWIVETIRKIKRRY